MSFFVVAPELMATYEFRLRFEDTDREWTAIILPADGPPNVVYGQCNTTACDLFEEIFRAIGKQGIVPSLN